MVMSEPSHGMLRAEYWCALTVRSIILPVHRWFDLIGGLFLIVLGVAGSLLVLEDAIDRAFNPVTSFVRPGATRLGVDSL